MNYLSLKSILPAVVVVERVTWQGVEIEDHLTIGQFGLNQRLALLVVFEVRSNGPFSCLKHCLSDIEIVDA